MSSRNLSWLMARKSLGERLQLRMTELGLHAAEVARRAKTTEATVSNWVLNNVKADHVKALMLLNIADAVEIDPRELLLGEPSAYAGVRESHGRYLSQDLQPDTLTVAFQLATEVEEAALAKKGKPLPPTKRAEIAKMAYELLEEDLPRAKVLRFVLSAVS